MRIAITGATGFLGRYIVARLAGAGHRLACWHRPTSDLGHFPKPIPPESVRWIEGRLGEEKAARELVHQADAVVHAALHHPSGGFRGAEGDLISFVEANVVGTLGLMEAARAAGVGRFVFISSCAVHDRILRDRVLDETHPLWMSNHYGAHKAAIEAFVHSFGSGQGWPICALRPTGIYGLAHPASDSKWYSLIRRVAGGKPVDCRGGGKEVHARDVARAVEILLDADPARITGEAFNCYDRYVSDYEVATLARELSGSRAEISGEPTAPLNQIDTGKLRALGMTYGGSELLRETVRSLIEGSQDPRLAGSRPVDPISNGGSS
jgi:nucleoside-diphosphate-sugar epimerase